MSPILLIIIILICVALSFFVLIQNPKGGGMAGTFGGFGNSVMGAKQSSEGVEKATWYAMAALAGVVLLSFVLMPKPTDRKATGNEMGKPLKATTAPAQIPSNVPTAPGTPAPATGTPPPATGTPAPASGTPSPASGAPAPASGTPAPAAGTPAPAPPAGS